MERARYDERTDRPGGKPPARRSPARTIAFRFACDATPVSAAWVGGAPQLMPESNALPSRTYRRVMDTQECSVSNRTPAGREVSYRRKVMKERYEGRPLVRLLEYYFLWCIGELSRRDERALEELAPKLTEILGHRGTWYEILEATVQMPSDIRDRIANAWINHINSAKSDTLIRTPREAAEEFVDDNFDIQPAGEPWPIEIN